MLALSGAGSGVSLFSFKTVIGTPAGIASAIISLVLLVTDRIIKHFLKAMAKKSFNIETLFYWPEVN